MFTKSKRSGAAKTAIPSIIGSDLRISGNLLADGEVQIEGIVEGDISCNSLVLGDDAAVTGRIEAQSVRVRGTVNGEIKAEYVLLGQTARVNGEIVHERLSIESGAHVEGQVRPMDEAKDRIAVVASPTPASPAPPGKFRQGAHEDGAG